MVPAVFQEFGADVPKALEPFWHWDFCCFHGPDWWRTHWSKTRKVRVDLADAVPDGWKDWLRWDEIVAPFTSGWMREAGENSIAMLRADQGKLLGFSRIVGSKL